MTDLRETVARAIHQGARLRGWDRYVSDQVKDEYRAMADAAIVAARPIIEREVIERLIARTEDELLWAEQHRNEPWHRGFSRVLAWLREDLDQP